jgi:hypothetical protein
MAEWEKKQMATSSDESEGVQEAAEDDVVNSEPQAQT